MAHSEALKKCTPPRRLAPRMLIALNMTNRQQVLPHVEGRFETLLSTYLDGCAPASLREIHLRENEGRIFKALDRAPEDESPGSK